MTPQVPLCDTPGVLLPFRRIVAVASLVFWTTPGACALAVGVHVAMDHRREEGGHLSRLFAELALAVVHGHHHHAAVAPDHEHPAAVDNAAEARTSTMPFAFVREAVSVVPSRDSDTAFPLKHRRGPPDPLFRAHCSLLL